MGAVGPGTPHRMTSDNPEDPQNGKSAERAESLGRLDDEQEEREPSDTTEGPAAEGEYDPAQGSPQGGAHPTGEDFPAEASRYDEPEHRRTPED